MKEGPITSAMKVSEILRRYPETLEVFRSHGCPDMRRGLFALRDHAGQMGSSDARNQGDTLLRELNAVASGKFFRTIKGGGHEETV